MYLQTTYIVLLLIRNPKKFGDSICLITIRNEKLVFQSASSSEVVDLVSYLLEGLKKRTKFVIALQDFDPEGANVWMLEY